MTPRRPDAADDEFADRLCAYHESLAQAGPDETAPPEAADTPTELAPRLARAQRCLQTLGRVRALLRPAESPASDDRGIAWSAQSPPATIGRFRVLETLGRGGAGIVLLALDPRLGRRVALKIPRPETLVSEELRRRFLREARAAGSLSHPGIVAVHEVGEAGPVAWIACEFCPGLSLARWLQQRSSGVAPRAVAVLVAAMADAIEHAHQRGILHRDLKPGNVLLVAVSDDGAAAADQDLATLAPKVADFGLAKLLDEAADETRSGTSLGTPAYMAPEQAEYRAELIGPATDIYGLGAILYELLAGRPPHRGQSGEETLRRVLIEEPPLPRVLNPLVPRDLEAIAMRCLEKHPQRRYPSAANLAADLRRFLAGEPTQARPLGLAAMALRWSRRRPWAAAFAGLLVVATAGLAAGAVWHVARLERELAENRRLRQAGEVREQVLRRDRYLIDMRLAHRAWNEGKLDQLLHTLKKYQPARGQPDERDFLWHYLWWLGHQQLATYGDHGGEVLDASPSPDGRLVATASADRALRIFEVETGRLRATLRGHEVGPEGQGNVNCVLFTADGRRLVTGGDDRTVRVWNIAASSPSATLRAHEGDVLCLALHPRQPILASAGVDHTIRLWNLDTGASLGTLDGHQHWVRGLAFRPSGQLVSVSHDDTLKVWDVESRQCQATLTLDLKDPTCLALHPSGDWAAAGGTNRKVQVVDLAKQRVATTLDGNDDWVRSVAFSSDGRRLAAGGTAPAVRIWSCDTVDSPKLSHTMPAHTARVRSVRFVGGGDRLVTAAGDGAAKLWDLAAYGYGQHFASLDKPVIWVSTSADGCMLAVSAGSQAKVWDVPGRRLVAAINTESEQSQGCALSTDGQRLLSGGDRAPTLLWDLRQKTLIKRLPDAGGQIDFVAISPGGDLAATSSGEPDVRLWNLPAGTPAGVLRIQEPDSLGRVEFSPDGKLLATSCHGLQCVIVWDLASQRQVRRLPLAIERFAFSPDGRHLASGANDRTVRVWDVVSGAVAHRLLGHEDEVRAVAYSPDGRLLASLADHGPLRIWSLENNEEVLSISRTGRWRRHLAFVNGGRALLAAAADAQERTELVLLGSVPSGRAGSRPTKEDRETK